LFTDEKNSTWNIWYNKIQNKLEINVDFFLLKSCLESNHTAAR